MVYSSPVRRDGRAVGIRGVLFNLTKLKQTEQALREQRGQAQKYLDVAGVIIVALDAEGRVTMINRKGCELLGAPEDAIIGRNSLEHFVPRSDETIMKTGYRRLVSEEQPLQECAESSLQTASGAERLVAWHLSLFRDETGRITGMLSSGNDITEQKQAEIALRASEEKYRQVVENANEMILIAQDGRLKYVNPQCATVLGYTSEELADCPFAELILPQDASLVSERHRRRSQGETLPGVYSFRVVTREGAIKRLEINVMKTEWNGRPATLNFLNDITDRKRTEEELEHHRQELQRLVAARTRELEETQEEMIKEEQMAALGWVAGRVAHEISNPLSAISNAAHFLRSVLLPGTSPAPASLAPRPSPVNSDPRPAEHLEMIEREIARANEVVSSLLDLARDQPPMPGFCQLGEILAEGTGKTSFPPGVGVNLQIPDSMPLLHVDHNQIVQAFVNLFACDLPAMNGPGRITIRAETETGGRQIRIRKTDSGPVVPGQQLVHLFEPLFSTRTVGIGLGPSISKSYVEANQGTIEAASISGEGTTFTITLPAAG